MVEDFLSFMHQILTPYESEYCQSFCLTWRTAVSNISITRILWRLTEMTATILINFPHVRGLSPHLHPIADLATRADMGPQIFTRGRWAPFQVKIRPVTRQDFEPSGKANIRPDPDDRVIVDRCSGGYGAHDATQFHDINTDQRKN